MRKVEKAPIGAQNFINFKTDYFSKKTKQQQAFRRGELMPKLLKIKGFLIF